MLSLPSKPWKRIKVEAKGSDWYRVTFVSPMDEPDEFHRAVSDDLGLCLSAEDTLGEPDWETRSVDLRIGDFETFKIRLVYVCIMIEGE